jgi:pectinesterase
MRRTSKLLSLAAMTLLLLCTSATDKKTTTIFMIGDSTMANKDVSNGKQERGWGQALQSYFDDNIVIDNHAMNGRSSKSFIDEGRWDKVLEKMKPGDYVIIQFGHNDEKPKADRHTDPGSTFDYNLAKFVRETREHGGIPVLMNCVVRRNWGASPDASEEGEPIGTKIDDEALRNTTASTSAPSEGSGEALALIDTHGLYRVAPRDVAARMNCHFVDANQLTHDLEQGMGPEASKRLHMWFLPDTEPSEPKGKQDNTHYNIYGAHVVARLLADALCEEIPVLKKYRTEADITVDRRGCGQFLSLEKAMETVDPTQPTTIQLLGGEWQKPALPKKSKVTFILRQGAAWK